MQVLTKSKQFIKGAAVTGSVAALLVAPGVAFAHGGGDNGDRGDRRDNNRSSQQSRSQGSQTAQRNQDKQKSDSRSWWEWKHERDRQDRHKTCDERQAALNNRATEYKEKYTKRLNGLNIVYGGVQTYVEGGVTVENYDALNAEAAASQATATNAVGAIAAPQLNCDADDDDQAQMDNNSNGADATLNQQIKDAKNALGEYRHDVLVLFDAAINS